MSTEQIARILAHAFSDRDTSFEYRPLLEELTRDNSIPSPPCSPPTVSPPPPVAEVKTCMPVRCPLMAREKALCRANEELKYRCTRCTNHMFRQRGRCSFQWHSGKFVDRCRYYHNESERAPDGGRD